MNKEEMQFLEREIKRSKLFGHLTFGQVMDKLEKQHDALIALRDDPAIPAYIRTIARAALD